MEGVEMNPPSSDPSIKVEILCKSVKVPLFFDDHFRLWIFSFLFFLAASLYPRPTSAICSDDRTDSDSRYKLTCKQFQLLQQLNRFFFNFFTTKFFLKIFEDKIKKLLKSF